MIWMRNFSTSFLSNFAIVILKIYEYAENAFMTFKIVSKIMIGYWIPNPMLLFVLFCTSLFQINMPTREFILNSQWQFQLSKGNFSFFASEISNKLAKLNTLQCQINIQDDYPIRDFFFHSRTVKGPRLLSKKFLSTQPLLLGSYPLINISYRIWLFTNLNKFWILLKLK